MNKERMLQVADAIEHSTIPNLGFNMNYEYINISELSEQEQSDLKAYDGNLKDYSGHDCKSLACVAGFACAVAQPDFVHQASNYTFSIAKNYLGLTLSEANSLFYNNDHFTDEILTLDNRKAARMLRACVQKERVLSWDEFFKLEKNNAD